MAPQVFTIEVPGEHARSVVGIKGLHLTVCILKEGKARFGDAGIIIFYPLKAGVRVAVFKQIKMRHGDAVMTAAQGEAITAPALDSASFKIFAVAHCIEDNIVDQCTIFHCRTIGKVVKANRNLFAAIGVEIKFRRDPLRGFAGIYRGTTNPIFGQDLAG